MKTGDLALMKHMGTSKVHIVRLAAQPYPDEKESPQGYPARTYLWSGRALCHCNPRYYWQKYDGVVEGSRQCRPCFSRWRAMDRPSVIGLLDKVDATPAERPLPTAWREVPSVGLAKDSKPDEDNESDRAVQELRRWVRGGRYVRLVKVLGDSAYGYGVHTGTVGKDEETDRWTTRASEAECLQRAWEIMAAGGDPF